MATGRGEGSVPRGKSLFSPRRFSPHLFRDLKEGCNDPVGSSE